jgi:hypothetical protein
MLKKFRAFFWDLEQEREAPNQNQYSCILKYIEESNHPLSDKNPINTT